MSIGTASGDWATSGRQQASCKMEKTNAKITRCARRAQRLRRGARKRRSIEVVLRDEIRPASLPGKVRTRRVGWSLVFLTRSGANNYENATAKNAADYKSGLRRGSIAIAVASDSRKVLLGSRLQKATAVLQTGGRRGSSTRFDFWLWKGNRCTPWIAARSASKDRVCCYYRMTTQHRKPLLALRAANQTYTRCGGSFGETCLQGAEELDGVFDV